MIRLDIGLIRLDNRLDIGLIRLDIGLILVQDDVSDHV